MKSQGKAKTILFVITQGAWGGAQRYVFDLAKSLSTVHTVIVAVGEPKGAQDLQNKLLDISNIRIIQLNHLKRNISIFHDILAIFELARLYKKIQPSIIHLNSSKVGILGSYAKVLIPKIGSRLVYTVHGWVFLEPLSRLVQLLYTALEKNTARFKDAIIVLSNKEKEVARTVLNIPEQKLHTIPLGIEPFPLLTSTQAKIQLRKNIIFHPNENIPWVGTIAGLYKTKGLDFLIQTIQQMKKNNQTLPFFFIIGEGPERKILEQMIQTAKLEKNIFLIGQKENAAQFLSAFDMFVLPSKKEGLPYVLLEAMQSNIPIVATDVGGVKEILKHSSQAQIIEFGDKQTLLQLLSKIPSIKTSHSPVENKLDLQKMVRSTVQMYWSLS